MKRRTLLGGLGVLATGSGAISTAASLANAVESSSDIRVINSQEMEVRAGVAFNDDGTVRKTDGYGPTESDSNYNYSEYYVENTTFFEREDPNAPESLKNISKSDAPVATVNRRDENVNDELKLQTAIDLDNWSGSAFYFENILEIENPTGQGQDIAIKYENQYGTDVNKNPDSVQEFKNNLFQQDVQQTYKFWVKNDDGDFHISPNPEDNSEEPFEPVRLESEETVQIDLEIDLTKYNISQFTEIDPKKGIRNAQEALGFRDEPDTITMLDAIEVGKFST